MLFVTTELETAKMLIQHKFKTHKHLPFFLQFLIILWDLLSQDRAEIIAEWKN